LRGRRGTEDCRDEGTLVLKGKFDEVAKELRVDGGGTARQDDARLDGRNRLAGGKTSNMHGKRFRSNAVGPQ
jgi:hypothetical protein